MIDIWEYADRTESIKDNKIKSFLSLIHPLHYSSPDHYRYAVRANLLNDGYKLMIYPVDVYIDNSYTIRQNDKKYKVLNQGTYRTKDKMKTPLYHWARMREIV
jgi:hypothetical protein